MAAGEKQDEWIRQIMECPVCLGKVRNHRALPCQHIFCHDCLNPLVHDGRLSCPTCRDIHVLKPGGVTRLPRSVLLMQSLELLCVQCMAKARDIICAHCNRWLCATCHEACRKIKPLLTETKRLLTLHSDMLQQIQVARTEIEKNESEVSSNVKRRSREIINALTVALEAKEKRLLNKIQTETQKHLTKLDALSKDISNQMKELNSFADKSDLQNLESTNMPELCSTWEKSIKDDVTTTSVSVCHFSFTASDEMPLDNLPNIGTLEASTSVRDLGPINYATGRVSHAVFATQRSGPGEPWCPSHAAVSPVSGNVVVTDIYKHRVQIFDRLGRFVSMFGSKGSKKGQFDFGCWYIAGGVAVTSVGNIAVCDTFNHRIQVFTERGEHRRTIGSKGSQSGSFRDPLGMCCHRDQLYVCDYSNRRVQVLALGGAVVREIRTSIRPCDVAVCAGGELVVVCGNELRVYSADGAHKATFRGEEPDALRLVYPRGVTVTEDGHIIVSDADTHQVHVLEQSGKLVRTFGSRGNKHGQMEWPVGVVCTRDGGIVVLDSNHKIQIFQFD